MPLTAATLFITWLFWWFIMPSSARIPPGKLLQPTEYEALTGYFAQSEKTTDDRSFRVYHNGTRFGLKLDSWAALHARVTELNAAASPDESYKLIFAARHGEGYHNVAEMHVGKNAWDCYWSMENGNQSMTWGPDALLTPRGLQQAAEAHRAWQRELKAGAPLPQLFYSSPLSRAASTLKITWTDIVIGPKAPTEQTPIFKEQWRETIGLHTCDRRNTKRWIEERYDFDFEEGFKEKDELWTRFEQETSRQQQIRIKAALDALFATESSPVVSITCHSGVITALLKVVKHRPFPMAPGAMIPLLIKATRATPTAPLDPGPSDVAPPCEVPAATSVSATVSVTEISMSTLRI
ncbi:uncharacterized protein L969DRAFT_93560 [Mixia osmundae IAM 14324]|uniref:Uncharacterized protein n=1 Tax=Mixia osmundae (strain CBS 9802 / IAM 14324 / JCM 22182 / KY 12970) TaxID=764103 RepID=G7DUB9_MIXOS|nr:uncharacterized protein L969DRAFT_93560 [Mixia osmundae IAM 14324]KEI41051.1 hypothetical protein L969DRAFT_93560 [Mixia osmundae IAM 14324]GAA94179.1 hypothetical protein E5Q_00827 [Mixia osmundae IAM 14324]